MGIEVGQEEIPALAEFFVKKYCEELACPPKKIPPEVQRSLKEYPWKGKMGDLGKILKRAVLVEPRSPVLSSIEFPPRETALQPGLGKIGLEELIRKKLEDFFSRWMGDEIDNLYAVVIEQVERPLIELALKKTRGNQLRAAKILGIHRNTLSSRIRKLQIET